MTPEQEKVLQFHKAFKITINDKPLIPSKEDRQLRIELIQEEFLELIDGFISKDIIEIADALGDLLYVVYGAAITCGIDLEPIFNEIHRSNMTKIGGHKSASGKWIKPDDYEPADLKSIINLQIKKEK